MRESYLGGLDAGGIALAHLVTGLALTSVVRRHGL